MLHLKGMMSQASSRPLSPDDAALQYYGSNTGFQSGTSDIIRRLHSKILHKRDLTLPLGTI